MFAVKCSGNMKKECENFRVDHDSKPIGVFHHPKFSSRTILHLCSCSAESSNGESIETSVTTIKPSLFMSLRRGGIEGKAQEESGVAEGSYGGGGQ